MTTEHDLIVINNRGRSFGVRLVRTGDRYGRDDCLTHDGETMVEFYDLSYPDKFGERGQFVSRYNLSDLAGRAYAYGLDLDGGVDVWTVDVDAMMQVDRLILRELNERGVHGDAGSNAH